jgi:hypothetical protein
LLTHIFKDDAAAFNAPKALCGQIVGRVKSIGIAIQRTYSQVARSQRQYHTLLSVRRVVDARQNV